PGLALPGCGRTQSLHNLPSDSNIRNAWLNFIFNEVSAHVSKTLGFCSLHFTADSFVNKTQVDAGFAERLILKSNAVPSILDTTGMSQKAPTMKDVACQTDTEKVSLLGKTFMNPLNVKMNSLTANNVTSKIAITSSCTGLVFPKTAPKEISTEPVQKSAFIMLQNKHIHSE
uniref:THAP-type domain-containing protein n=1 Tax=Sinocyclocheilus rhinocerous TaxID=307959 RepID=A0A673JRN6_9TELE